MICEKCEFCVSIDEGKNGFMYVECSSSTPNVTWTMCDSDEIPDKCAVKKFQPKEAKPEQPVEDLTPEDKPTCGQYKENISGPIPHPNIYTCTIKGHLPECETCRCDLWEAAELSTKNSLEIMPEKLYEENRIFELLKVITIAIEVKNYKYTNEWMTELFKRIDRLSNMEKNNG